MKRLALWLPITAGVMCLIGMEILVQALSYFGSMRMAGLGIGLMILAYFLVSERVMNWVEARIQAEESKSAQPAAC